MNSRHQTRPHVGANGEGLPENNHATIEYIRRMVFLQINERCLSRLFVLNLDILVKLVESKRNRPRPINKLHGLMKLQC